MVAVFGVGDWTAIDGSATDATAARPSNTIWLRLKPALPGKTFIGLVCSRLSAICQSVYRRWHATGHCSADWSTVSNKNFVSWCLGGQAIAPGFHCWTSQPAVEPCHLSCCPDLSIS